MQPKQTFLEYLKTKIPMFKPKPWELDEIESLQKLYNKEINGISIPQKLVQSETHKKIIFYFVDYIGSQMTEEEKIRDRQTRFLSDEAIKNLPLDY